jgi:hypothetical protein
MAERNALGEDEETAERKMDDTHLGIDYKKHWQANNPEHWQDKANTTREFLENLSPKLEYKLIKAIERSKEYLYALISERKDKELIKHKSAIYDMLQQKIGIPVDHLLHCEQSITIPKKE